MKFQIRKAVPSDTNKIYQLIRELAEYEKLLDKVITDEENLKKELFAIDSPVEVWLAETKEDVVGYALFFTSFSTFLGKRGIFLEDLFVKPDFRKLGIGKALLEKVISLAKERNCGRVEWAVLDWNRSAIDFYENRSAVLLNDWKIFRLTEDKF